MSEAHGCATSVDTSADETRLLRPGRSCWRVESAERVAVLVDGSAYFDAFADAAERARHSIFIVGWDFNSGVRLRPQQAGFGGRDEIGDSCSGSWSGTADSRSTFSIGISRSSTRYSASSSRGCLGAAP
jgi:hypothetical protein